MIPGRFGNQNKKFANFHCYLAFINLKPQTFLLILCNSQSQKEGALNMQTTIWLFCHMNAKCTITAEDWGRLKQSTDLSDGGEGGEGGWGRKAVRDCKAICRLLVRQPASFVWAEKASEPWFRTAWFPSMSHSLSHELGSEWASERTNEWAQQSAYETAPRKQRGACESVSSAGKRANGRPIGPVLTFGFLVVLDHSDLLVSDLTDVVNLKHFSNNISVAKY